MLSRNFQFPRGHRLSRFSTVSLLAVAFIAIIIALPIARFTAGASATGVSVLQVNGRPYGVATTVHVVAIQPGAATIQIALANNAIDGGIETPSAMCKSTPNCLAAVNGDFFTGSSSSGQGLGDALGGIIQSCVLVHTPQVTHQQVNLDTHTVSQGLNWSSTIDVNGTEVPMTAINRERPLTYLGSRLPLKGAVMFTAPYEPKTPAAPGRITYEFTQVPNSSISTAPPTTTTATSTTTTTSSTTTTTLPGSTTTSTTTTTLPPPPTAPTTVDTETSLTLTGETIGALQVGTGQVDVSAPFSNPLDQLHLGESVIMTTSSTAGCDSVGGHPILINQGVVQPQSSTDALLYHRYPRTAVGWTATGETIIMSVNGKDGISGATASQLVRMLRALKVVTAINLDGGGSTSLYAEGKNLSRTTSSTERPVAMALLVMAAP